MTPKDKDIKENKEDTKSPKEEKELNKQNKRILVVEEELKKAKADVEHWKNEYYRAYADTKNLRNNLEKDHREALKYRIEGFVGDLLPVLDSFQSVLDKEVTDPALKNYLIGFNYVYKNLVAILENEGVKVIAPKENDKFDPSTMNAVDTVEKEKENIVTKVYTNGYQLHDHLIRSAGVQVSVIKKEEPADKKTDA